MNIGFFGTTAPFLRGMQDCMDVTTKLFLYNTFTKMLSGPYYPAGEALSDASCFGDRFPAVVPTRREAPEWGSWACPFRVRVGPCDLNHYILRDVRPRHFLLHK